VAIAESHVSSVPIVSRDAELQSLHVLRLEIAEYEPIECRGDA
jgi:hypothetical protein